MRFIYRNITRLVKLFLFRFFYPLVYILFSLRPIKRNKVVFVELMSAEVTPSFKLLLDRIQKEGTFKVKVLLLNQLRMSYLSKLFLNFRVLWAIGNAQYLFLDNTFPLISSSPIRRGTTVIQTWHGCGAFKKFGYSLVKGNTQSSGWDYKLYPLHNHYDHVFVSGEKAIGPYAEAFGMENDLDKVHAVGVSRTDVYFDKEFIAAAVEKVRAFNPSIAGKKILLYAPTYRKSVTSATLPVRLKYDMLKEALGDEWVLLIKRHNFLIDPIEIPQDCQDFAFDVTGDFEIDELLCAADACISDFSSVIFEYALFERPILFFVPDLESYYTARGFYFRFDDIVCGPVARTTTKLIEGIQNLSEADVERVRAFKNEFMEKCDGRSTDRILSIIFGDKIKSVAPHQLTAEE